MVKPYHVSLTIAAMSSMTADSNSGASPVRQCSLALIVDSCCKVPKSYAASNLCNALAVNYGGLEGFQTDNHATILAARAVGGAFVVRR